MKFKNMYFNILFILLKKEWLYESVHELGENIIFFPKFHCELNYIENIWAFAKSQVRKDCEFSFELLKKKLPKILDEIPINHFKKMERHCFRFMSGNILIKLKLLFIIILINNDMKNRL